MRQATHTRTLPRQDSHQPRQILHLRSTWVRNGSVEKQVRAIIRHMDHQRWTHFVGKIEPLTPILYGDQVLQDNILTAEEVDLHRWHRIPWEWKRGLRSGLEVVRNLVRHERISLIHCHDNRANLLGLIAGRWAGIPVIISLYGWILTSLKLQLLAKLDAHLLRFADAIIASSSSLLALIPLSCRSKTVVVLNAVETTSQPHTDTEIQNVRGRLGLAADDPVVTAVGRLSLEKGQNVLVAAAKRVAASVPNAKFLIVGEGPSKGPLALQIASLGLEHNVILTGAVDEFTLAHIRSFSDIIVQPSISESLPLSVLEGMAYGKPVVATQVGSVSNAVIEGETGYLVPPGSSEHLGDAVVKMLRLPAERKAMGRRAAELVRDQFSTTTMVQQIEGIYREVLSRRDILA